jgi:hypothetical protein
VHGGGLGASSGVERRYVRPSTAGNVLVTSVVGIEKAGGTTLKVAASTLVQSRAMPNAAARVMGLRPVDVPNLLPIGSDLKVRIQNMSVASGEIRSHNRELTVYLNDIEQYHTVTHWHLTTGGTSGCGSGGEWIGLSRLFSSCGRSIARRVWKFAAIPTNPNSWYLSNERQKSTRSPRSRFYQLWPFLPRPLLHS